MSPRSAATKPATAPPPSTCANPPSPCPFADALVFEPDEPGPSDDLRILFEAASNLDDESKNHLRALIEGVLLRHEAHRWSNTG